MALLLRDDVPAPKQPAKRRHALKVPKTLESILAFCGLVAAVLMVFDVGDGPVAIFKLAMCLVLPGWAILLRLPEVDPAARLVWTVVASVVTFTVVALAMGWLQLWSPRPVAAALLIAAAACIVVVPPRVGPGWGLGGLSRPTFRASAAWLVLVAALVMWVVGLAFASREPLGVWGLLVAFPVMWYGALALAVGLCIWGVAARTVASDRFLGAAMTGLVLILYASASLLAQVPRLPWTYKHIAVTDFIGAVGHIDPSIDIYNRWPGFFSLSALLGEVMGYRDALSYAGWAETGFALIDVVLVLAIARTLSRNPRIHWTAALVFTLTNWVNQNYYSPQAFAYTLHLVMCLVVLTFLRGTPAAWVRRLEQRLTRLSPRLPQRSAEDGATYGRSTQNKAIAAVLALQVVIVVSHQLTPYLAILGLFPLFIVGYFRPKWLATALLGIAVIYLSPHAEFIRSKYGFFNGFNIFANAGYKDSGTAPGQWLLTGRWVARGAVVLSALTGLLAVAGFARRILQGHVRSTLVVGLMAAAPILGLFGTSYGGEARLRVYLFALPWLAIGVAWLFWSGTVRVRAAAVGASAALTVMALLFTGIYFLPEADVRVPSADVAASKWLDSRVQNGDLVMETNYHLPLLIGSNYPNYLDTGGVSSLSRILKKATRAVTAQDVIERADRLRGSAGVKPSEKIYVIISDKQQTSSSQKAIPAGIVRKFERDLALESNVERVFVNESVRIYQISKTT